MSAPGEGGTPLAGAAGSRTLSYGAILHEIESAPLSWLAGIAACAVRTCARRRFFRSNDVLMRFLSEAVNQCDPPNAPDQRPGAKT